MKADETLRRELVGAWESADTLEEALVGITNAVERAAPAAVRIEDRVFEGWERNPYSNPTACGLELLAAAEEDEPYQFNICALWRDIESGRYFMASDSGCSCPSPFEDVRTVSDLTEVTTRTAAQSFLVSGGMGYTAATTAGLLRSIEENLPRW